MTSTPFFHVLLGSLALACAAALAGRERFPGAALGLLAALSLPLALAPGGDAGGLEVFSLAGDAVLLFVAYRLGLDARGAAGSVPLVLLAVLGTSWVAVGAPLLAAFASLVPLSGGGADARFGPAAVLAALLLLLPDGAPRHAERPGERASGAQGLEAFHGLLAFLLLPLIAIADEMARSPATGRAAGAAFWQVHAGAFAAALGAGAIAGLLGRQVQQRCAARSSLALAHTATALAPALLAGWIHPATAPIAALVAGVAAGGARSRSPHADAGGAPAGLSASLPASSFLASAAVFALVGAAAARGLGRPEWNVGLALGAGALALRLLTVVTFAGFYHCLRPGRVSWPWIGRIAWLSAPGTLTAAWLLSRLPLHAAPWPAEAPSGGSRLLGLFVPVFALQLAAEALARVVRGGRAIGPHPRGRFELARARLLALRALRDAVSTLSERGELDGLSHADRERIATDLDRRLLLAGIEMDELLHTHPGLRRQGQAALRDELVRAAVRSLEEAVRDGAIPRAALEALRPELHAWLLPGSRHAAPRRPAAGGALEETEAGDGARR